MYSAILLLCALATGQNCGPQGCSVQPAPMPVQPSYLPAFFEQGLPSLEVPPVLDIRTATITYKGVQFQVHGTYNEATGDITWLPDDPFNKRSYAAAVARRNAPKPKPKATPSPVVRPTGELPKAIGQVADPFPGGVVAEKLHRETKYTAIGGEAQRFVAEAVAEDKSDGRLHVTVIGSDADRAQVVNDLNSHPAFAALKADLMIQDYTPEEWPVNPQLGYVTAGKPSIIIQAAKGPHDPKGGRVVYRALDYSMGPEALAESIRKADPSYDASKDPGPATGIGASKCPFGFTKDHWPVIGVVTVVVFLLIKLPTKES